MNVDGDIVDDGCNGEMLSNVVIGEEGVGGEVDESDGEMKEVDKSLTTPITRTVLTTAE